MERKIIIKVFLPAIIIFMHANAQNTERQQEINDSLKAIKLIDSLKAIIHLQKGDTNEVNALFKLSDKVRDASRELIFDSGATFARQGLALAQKIKYRKGEADCYYSLGVGYQSTQDQTQAIQNYFNALKIYTEINDIIGIATVHIFLAGCYDAIGDKNSSLPHLLAGLNVIETYKIDNLKFGSYGQVAQFYLAELGYYYLQVNKLDSALLYTEKAIKNNYQINKSAWNYPVYLLGNIQRQKGNYELALSTYRLATTLAKQNKIFSDTLHAFTGLASLFKMQGNSDSSIYYAQKVVQSVDPYRASEDFVESVNNLAEVYNSTGRLDSALRYTKISHALNDSIYNLKKNREILNYTFNEKLKQQEMISAQVKYKSKVQLYAVIGGLLVMLFIAGILWNNNRQRKKAYGLLQNQKEETEIQKNRVEEALEELKTTQAQLIQSEKMASLGELTTGIAHEIQNPLNFVNNFSEVNIELTAELKDELKKTGMEAKDKMNLEQLLDDLIENEGKISHHGKRADAIVKSMLQHSQISSGRKEPTDINALAEEYLRLAFHGAKAKDANFSVILKSDFDPSVGNVSLIAQDVGRVLLNLFNNAFYAVAAKKKISSEAYEPTVTLSTKRVDNKVIISIKDNGMGIPQKIIDKIFQPFFTTKPTGQGTGLGLSLSYDIIKSHKGEITVQSKDKEWSEFNVSLPI